MHLKSTTLTLAFTIAALTFIGAPQPAESAQCVNVSLLDPNGVIVTTDAPIVGMMLGGIPVIQGEFPPHAGTTAGTVVPCPQIIVDQVTSLFSETCTTAGRRTSAAQMHGVNIEVIAKGCTDMSAALNVEE